LSNDAVITGNTVCGNNTEDVQAATNAEIFINQSSNNTVTDNVTTDPACFMVGTLIKTPDAEIAVEELKRGDVVVTIIIVAIQGK
jgi:Hint domain